MNSLFEKCWKKSINIFMRRREACSDREARLDVSLFNTFLMANKFFFHNLNIRGSEEFIFSKGFCHLWGCYAESSFEERKL